LEIAMGSTIILLILAAGGEVFLVCALIQFINEGLHARARRKAVSIYSCAPPAGERVRARQRKVIQIPVRQSSQVKTETGQRASRSS
jgi:uncharacterized membrane protein